jgi:hypothetical protein
VSYKTIFFAIPIIAMLVIPTVAFSNFTPTCDPNNPETCLYQTPDKFKIKNSKNNTELTYTDITGNDRTIFVAYRYPVETEGLLPAVIWVPGGSNGQTDPKGSMAEWSKITAKAGYFSVSIAHPPRDTAQQDALCAELNSTIMIKKFSANTCADFTHINFDKPRDVKRVIEWLNGPEWKGIIDTDKIAVGGHSGGSGAALTVAGAYREIVAVSIDNKELARSAPIQIDDDQPIAFLALSPQMPGRAGFFESSHGQSMNSWQGIDRPVFIATGEGDNSCNPSPSLCLGGQTPFGRIIAYERMPESDNKYLLYINDERTFHSLFNLQKSDCKKQDVNRPTCSSIVEVLSTSALAFLDWHLKGYSDAKEWLDSDNIEIATNQIVDWNQK